MAVTLAALGAPPAGGRHSLFFHRVHKKCCFEAMPGSFEPPPDSFAAALSERDPAAGQFAVEYMATAGVMEVTDFPPAEARAFAAKIKVFCFDNLEDADVDVLMHEYREEYGGCVRDVVESVEALHPYFDNDIDRHPKATAKQRCGRVGLEVWLKTEDDAEPRPITEAEAKKVCRKINKAASNSSPNTSSTSSSIIPQQRPSKKGIMMTLGADLCEEELSLADMLKLHASMGTVPDVEMVKAVRENQDTIQVALNRGDIEIAVFLQIVTASMLKQETIKTGITEEDIVKAHKQVNRSGAGRFRKPDPVGVRACMTRWVESVDPETGEHKLNSYVLTGVRCEPHALVAQQMP